MQDALIGSVLAGQRIEGVAGRGGMGVVYRGTDVALERRVAVKVIAPALASDPTFRRRFIAESRIAASLDHPNVIPIYQAGEEDGVLFQVMRFVEGEDLREILSREGRLDPVRAVRILTQVAAALEAAHAHGLVHRDVKPANVLLAAGDHVYLTDFGLSKRAGGEDETRTAQVIGTVNYIAPEQIRGHGVDARTDVYALGAVLFQMLTGRVPFPLDSDEAKMWAHIAEPPPRPSEAGPEALRRFDEVIERAMRKDPSDRYATAGDLSRAATAALDETADEIAADALGGTRAADVGGAPAVLPVRMTAGPPARPYSRSEYRRALIANALLDSLSVVLAGVIIVAGLLFGAMTVAVPLALVVYALGAVRAFFDSEVAEAVLERERAKRRGKLHRGAMADLGALSEDIRPLVVRAHEMRRRIHDVIRRAELPYPEVAAEVDQLVATMEQTAMRAQLLDDGLRDAPPAEVARRLERVRARRDASREQLAQALDYQLSVQRRMEKQLRRFHDEMERMLVELDTVRGNLISVSASEETYNQQRLAGGVRALRDDMGAVAAGMAAAYNDQQDVSATLNRISADA